MHGAARFRNLNCKKNAKFPRLSTEERRPGAVLNKRKLGQIYG